MSYILEALKKAEAERHGGASQAAHRPVFSVPPQRQSPWRMAWPWAGLLALAALAAGALWYGTPTREQTPASPPAPPLAQVQASSPATETSPRASVPGEIKPPPAPEEPAKPAKPETPPPRAKEKAAAKPPAEKEARKPEKREAVAPAKAAATEERRVATLRELPVQVQGQIPSFTVGGYIYSGNKNSRSVLINKRLVREGDEIAPGLVLEEMRPDGMVLNYQGYRYRTGY